MANTRDDGMAGCDSLYVHTEHFEHGDSEGRYKGR